MTPDEQEQWVRVYCNRIRDEVIARIRQGDVPTGWNGIELRWWLADVFEYNTFERGKGADSDYRNRYRRYKNEERVRNLV